MLKINNISFWNRGEKNNGGLQINWSDEGGFGQLTIWLDRKNKLHIDTEERGKDFAITVLSLIIKKAKEI